MKYIRLIQDAKQTEYILQVYDDKQSYLISDWTPLAHGESLSKLVSTLARDISPSNVDGWLMSGWTILWTQPYDEFVNTYPEYFI